MAHIRKNILINAPVEKVYAFARDPERWSTWYVNLSAPEEIKGHGEVGTIAKHNFAIAGFAFPVTTRVLEDQPGPKVAHGRVAIEGPLSGEQAWTYTANGDVTEVVAEVDYTIPGKALGKIADKFVIEKMQERGMEHTLENLKLLCESEVTAKVHV